MNWDTIKPEIKALFAAMSADPETGQGALVSVWKDEPRPFTPTDTAAIMLLSITAVVGQGRDEKVILEDDTQPQGQEQQDQWRGNRYFTLTVQVESQIQTDTGDATEYLERVRNALNFQGNRQTLLALNLAWIETLATVELPAPVDDRNRSVRAMDVMFARRITVLDPVRRGYIATVDLTPILTIR